MLASALTKGIYRDGVTVTVAVREPTWEPENVDEEKPKKYSKEKGFGLFCLE